MPEKEILVLGNPDLWKPSAEVVDPSSADGLIRDLSDTLAAFRETNGFGRAIAAPQIGVRQRIIFTNLNGGFPLINPIIAKASEEMFELWDDCFSLPGLMVRVSRHRSITVSYQEPSGRRVELEAADDISELLQHEIDHLDGILATDRAIGPRAFAMRSEVTMT